MLRKLRHEGMLKYLGKRTFWLSSFVREERDCVMELHKLGLISITDSIVKAI